MALQLRRGLEADRLGITPAVGEPIITEQLKLYIGDGTTPGGNLISGGTNVVTDTSPQLGGDLDVNGHSIVSASNANITIAPNGTGKVVIGNNLDVNGHNIISSNNGNINLTPNGTGLVILHGDLKVDSFGNITKTGELNISPTTILTVGNAVTPVDGNLYITRNSLSNVWGQGFTFAQSHNVADATNFTFYRTRGTGLSPTAVANGDDIIDINFVGYDGAGQRGGAVLSAIIDGVVSVGVMPTKFQFQTHNGTSLGVRAELGPAGVLKVNSISNLTGSTINISGTGIVTATNAIIGNGAASPAAGPILTVNGTVTGGSLAAGSIFSGGTTLLGTAITAVNSATFTSTISTTTMTVSNVSVGTITVGMALSGGSVTAGTYVVAFVSGINGGAGTYTLNQTATGTPTTGTSYTVSVSQLVTSTTITSGGTVNLIGNVKIPGQNSLQFADFDSSNYVAFKAPATVASDVTWTLPAADGTSGQVLSTNGFGTLSWATAGGGSGLLSRTTVSETTASLANGATGNISIVGAKGYVLYKIQTSVAAWVRIYTSSAARTADSARAEGVDPLPGAGVIAEVITTGAATIIMSPAVVGFNDETLPTSIISLAVTNKSGSSSTVTVTLSILQIEV
jgi:hypothetical protein